MNLLKKPQAAVAFLFILSSLINLYKLNGHLFFSHEQGRSAYAAKGIYTLKDPTLTGPPTEIPGLFTPPWYYYFLAMPYGISKGNPLPVALVQTILISTTAPIIYILFKKLTGSNKWSFVAGIFSAFSFEFISYARWFINTPPAIPVSALAFYFLISYWQTSKQKYLALYGIAATMASIFQIVLIFQFAALWLALTVLKIIKYPKSTTIVSTALFALLVISPLIVFDFRNQHISSKAIADFVTGTSDYPYKFSLSNSLILYLKEVTTIFKRTIFNSNNQVLLTIFITLAAIGIIQFALEPKNRRLLATIILMTFMGLGIFIFNIGLTQLYAATGIGLILLFTLSIKSLISNPKTQAVAIVLSILWLFSLAKNLTFLDQNRAMFFVTTSAGVNYKDQKAVLDFIRHDANDQEYRIEAFTVPYLKPQGWEYLHEYFFGESDNKTAKLTYIIIQKNVEDFWRETWTRDLGPSDLVRQLRFNDILVEKRILKTS